MFKRLNWRGITRIFVCAVLAAFCSPVFAQSAPRALSDWDRDVFFFGGRFQSDYFQESFNPVTANYEDNYVIGGGFQRFFTEWNGIRFGAEGGLAARFGDATSLELWGGGVWRYDGFTLGPVRISPAVTIGLSAVTGTIGTETSRASTLNPPSTVPLLYYLGPELNFSLVDHPNMEVFWRIQHRSGGFGTIAPIDGSNADTIGIRWKF